MKNRNTVFHLILLLVGISGILTYVFDIEDLICKRQLVVLAAMAPCLLFWGAWRIRGKLLPAVMIAVFAGCVFLCGNRIWTQLQMLPYFLSCIDGSSYWYMYDMTGFLVCVFGILSVLMFLVECVLGWHFVMWGLSMALLLSVPFTGIDPGWFCIVLLGIYQVFFAVLCAGKRARERSKATLQAGKIVACLLAVFLLVSQIIAGGGDGFLYRWAEEIDPTLQQIESEIAITVKNQQNVRRVNRGNLYTTGKVVMEIAAEEKPTETIYLRDFSGGSYSRGIWQPAADREILEQIDSRVGTVNLFINMYYKVNGAEKDKSRVLYVKRANQDTPSYGIYYGQWHSHSWENHFLSAGEEGYAYYEKKDMKPDWDAENTSGFVLAFDINEDRDDLRRTYLYDRERNLHHAYGDAAKRAYTQVNRQSLPGLSALQQENPLKKEADITAFIKDYLQTHGTYNDSPGRIPLGREPVEYFLFESQQGYCQHFASAATLLYRMYGIPARYAMGFVIRPSDFVKNDEGLYCAVITDEAAHAWPEIFDDELGWTPVEVTPADERQAGTAGGQQNSAETETSDESPERPETKEPQTPQDTRQDDKQEDAVQNGEKSGGQRTGLLLAAAGILAAVLIAAAAGRKLYLQSLAQMDCRKAFAKMLEKLQRRGFLCGCDGGEEDFAQKLAETVESVSVEEAAQAVEIVSRAAFGNISVEDEEEEAVRQLYRKIAAWAKENRNRKK
ncbi:transglutaminase domain-containing protein [Anaerovoracaceae bacterium 42-11]